MYGAWEQYLGLEHIDNTPKRAYAANQVRSSLSLCKNPSLLSVLICLNAFVVEPTCI